MPISDHIGGFIRPGFNPLLVPNAPTIGTASAGGGLDLSIAFTAPSDVGGGAITSYEAIATDTVSGVVFIASGSSTPISITGLTDGQSYTTTVTAINAYGPSGISGTSNSIQAQDIAGALWAWGANSNGALGDGTTTGRSSPVQIGALTNWIKRAAGYYWNISAKIDGTLWAAGGNYSGVLGQGNTTNYSSPVQIGTLTDWTAEIGAGRVHFMGVKSDGSLWAIGNNSQGQLGDGSTTARSSPVQVGALTNWSKVACGESHTFAIKTDGTLWSWGKNGNGQLGKGNTTNTCSNWIAHYMEVTRFWGRVRISH